MVPDKYNTTWLRSSFLCGSNLRELVIGALTSQFAEVNWFVVEGGKGSMKRKIQYSGFACVMAAVLRRGYGGWRGVGGRQEAILARGTAVAILGRYAEYMLRRGGWV